MKALRQSFSMWCFENRGVNAEKLLAGAAQIGYSGVDLIDEKLWPVARDNGLAIAAIGGHGTIENGMNRLENASRIEQEVRENLAKAHEWEIPILICFSGNRSGISDEEGWAACTETLGRLAPEAAAAGVTLAMELLNSKVDHRDYQCDHTAWGVELCRRVDSPAVKLLYDIYHMQIMEGDLVRTIRQYHDHIAHFHTAGNPGRGQPDATQEINYASIYGAISKTSYTGFVSHEFLPTGDPLNGLKRAFDDAQSAFATYTA